MREQAMREQDIAGIKKRLYVRREELLMDFRKQNAEAAELMDKEVPDVGDMSVTESLRDLLHLLSEGAREEILRIDEALDRIENGTYGQCQLCDEPIPAKRLEVLPHTRHCVECEERLEREHAAKAPPEKGKI
jgi:DnaK suppressor protein